MEVQYYCKLLDFSFNSIITPFLETHRVVVTALQPHHLTLPFLVWRKIYGGCEMCMAPQYGKLWKTTHSVCRYQKLILGNKHITILILDDFYTN